MQFLTKYQIRDKVENFLEGIPNNSRILYSEDLDKEFIHIGETIEHINHKHQTFLNELDKDTEHDKNIRQGNFRRK